MKSVLVAALVAAFVLRAGAMPGAPERLSETGLYLPGTLRVDPRNRAFTPQYPLWTDGAQKSRWLQLPSGEPIDTSDVDRWRFPMGTRFWKEFAFNGRKVETRMLWRTGDGSWSFASYVWNEAQTDATLAPPEGIRNVLTLAPGKAHSVPSLEDCRACHDNGTAVLGFTALQLSTDRDPLAPHAEAVQPGTMTLQTLVDENRIAPARAEFRTRPPRIPGDALTRAVMGYLSANCGHCHNDHSPLATARMPLLASAYPASDQVERTIDTLRALTTKWDVPHTSPGTTTFVRPGEPDVSALFVRMRSRRPSSQMPPLGTSLPDHSALQLIQAWIMDLAATAAPLDERDPAWRTARVDTTP